MKRLVAVMLAMVACGAPVREDDDRRSVDAGTVTGDVYGDTCDMLADALPGIVEKAHDDEGGAIDAETERLWRAARSFFVHYERGQCAIAAWACSDDDMAVVRAAAGCLLAMDERPYPGELRYSTRSIDWYDAVRECYQTIDSQTRVISNCCMQAINVDMMGFGPNCTPPGAQP